MNENTNKVGRVNFDNRSINVYNSLDEPLFRITDVADILDYSVGNAWTLASNCEEDEKLNLPMIVAGQRRMVTFVTEHGLYNILAQSRKPLAKKWRRIIFDQLIEMRKSKNWDVVQQFDDWDHRLDELYFDDDKNILMQSVTVQGGDVIQIPFVSDAEIEY